MDVSTRASLVARVAPYLPAGAPVPQSWDELPLTTRLLIEQGDAEAAQVFQGVMSAELEATVLAGKWGAEAPAPRDLAAEKEAAIAAWFDAHPIASPEEQERQLRERLAEQDVMRRNSMVATYGRWGA
ncbi:hypothetical protein [Synechococcus sp. LA31]|uniref:hypothetical protein n=1 Tax=Synechococcus sp. LA31 TaxID=2741953 RepID=UPI001BDCCB2A|nr:hypothetical protein [Synechococcus sp. LA31]QVV66768.1 hypothetical protein KJJ24_09755 [Synechococcus sp. LA31]